MKIELTRQHKEDSKHPIQGGGTPEDRGMMKKMWLHRKELMKLPLKEGKKKKKKEAVTLEKLEELVFVW